jgi:hypothetical protein
MDIPCICAGDHGTDTITLKDPLDYRSASTMQKAIVLLKSEDEDASSASVLAVLGEAYLLYGIASWSLVDLKGKPIPVTPENVQRHLLTHVDAAMSVESEADEKFSKVVLLPLLKRGSSSSPPTRTTDSTSRTTGLPDISPTSSSPSSTTTTQTGGTVTTTKRRGGGSSSSQNSVSAA